MNHLVSAKMRFYFSEPEVSFCQVATNKMPKDTISQWLFDKLSAICGHRTGSSLESGVFSLFG